MWNLLSMSDTGCVYYNVILANISVFPLYAPSSGGTQLLKYDRR